VRTCVGGVCRSKLTLSQTCTRPGKVGLQAGRTRKGVSTRVVIEDPGPLLSRAHGFRDFGEICHSARHVAVPVRASSSRRDDNINTMMITYRLNNRFQCPATTALQRARLAANRTGSPLGVTNTNSAVRGFKHCLISSVGARFWAHYARFTCLSGGSRLCGAA